MTWKNVTILCGNGVDAAISSARQDTAVVVLDREDLLWPMISLLEAEGTDELERVIFGATVRLETFLGFVSQLPTDFRGDVLICTSDWGAYLSAPASVGPGRVLYKLTQTDLAFYLKAHFGERVQSVRRIEPPVKAELVECAA